MKLNPLVLMRREFDGTGIIFDPENNKALTINAVGTVIWEAIDKGLSEAEIADCITAKFDVGKTVAVRDVAAFLATLKAKGLLADE